MTRLAAAAVALGFALLAIGSPAQAARRSRPVLANRCSAMKTASRARFIGVAGPDLYRAARRTRAGAARFYLKPTGLGTYMLYDAGRRLMAAGSSGGVGRTATAGPPAEWRL